MAKMSSILCALRKKLSRLEKEIDSPQKIHISQNKSKYMYLVDGHPCMMMNISFVTLINFIKTIFAHEIFLYSSFFFFLSVFSDVDFLVHMDVLLKISAEEEQTEERKKGKKKHQEQKWFGLSRS